MYSTSICNVMIFSTICVCVCVRVRACERACGRACVRAGVRACVRACVRVDRPRKSGNARGQKRAGEGERERKEELHRSSFLINIS